MAWEVTGDGGEGPEEVERGGSDRRESGRGGVRPALGDALAQTAGVVAVKSLAQTFLEADLLGVRSDHPPPGHGLEKALGQADLPSQGKGGEEGGETIQDSYFEEIMAKGKEGLV